MRYLVRWTASQASHPSVFSVQIAHAFFETFTEAREALAAPFAAGVERGHIADQEGKPWRIIVATRKRGAKAKIAAWVEG